MPLSVSGPNKQEDINKNLKELTVVIKKFNVASGKLNKAMLCLTFVMVIVAAIELATNL